MNDGIPKPPFTVQYVSVDAVIEGIMAQGRGTLMWPAKKVSGGCTKAWLFTGPTLDGIAASFILAGYTPFTYVYCVFSSQHGQSSS